MAPFLIGPALAVEKILLVNFIKKSLVSESDQAFLLHFPIRKRLLHHGLNMKRCSISA